MYEILLSLSHVVPTLRCEYFVSQVHNTLRCTLLVHTGGIDGMWKISKAAVSASWSARKGEAVNLQLLQGIRIWQRRWHHGNCKDFMGLTGHALSKRLEKRDVQSRSKKRPQSQGHNPCKYHVVPSK